MKKQELLDYIDNNADFEINNLFIFDNKVSYSFVDGKASRTQFIDVKMDDSIETVATRIGEKIKSANSKK